MYVINSDSHPNADQKMSHRLKLNAVHFANSLEDEKSLLDTSTEVLESKLVGPLQWTQADIHQRIWLELERQRDTCQVYRAKERERPA